MCMYMVQVAFYAGGEVLALLLEREGAMTEWRRLLGPGINLDFFLFVAYVYMCVRYIYVYVYYIALLLEREGAVTEW